MGKMLSLLSPLYSPLLGGQQHVKWTASNCGPLMDLLAITQVSMIFAAWNQIEEVIDQGLPLPSDYPVMFANFFPGICLAKLLHFSMICGFFISVRVKKGASKWQAGRAYLSILLMVSVTTNSFLPATRKTFESNTGLKPDYRRNGDIDAHYMIFYLFLNFSASFTTALMTAICSDDIDLDYGRLYVSNLSILSCWNPSIWFRWISSSTNRYPAASSISDAEIKRKYKLLTDSSLIGRDRTLQMLERSNQWFDSFVIMFVRADLALGVIIFGLSLAFATGFTTAVTEELKYVLLDFWNFPTLKDIIHIFGYAWAFMTVLVILFFPIYIFWAQFARKNSKAATRLEEECAEGGILPSSVNDMEREYQGSSEITGGVDDVKVGQSDWRGQYVFALTVGLFFVFF